MISKIRFGLPWGFYSLDGASIVDGRRVDLALGAQGVWRVSVLDDRRWFFGSFLSAKKIGAHRCMNCSPEADDEHDNPGGQLATLRVSRRRSWNSYMLAVYVVVDGVDLGTVGSGEEVEFNVLPGLHVVIAALWRSPWSSNHLSLDFAPGETTLVEVSVTGNHDSPDGSGLKCIVRRQEPGQ
ncbi:MAG: hypothetical protein JKY65_13300 [Planctomycetes bacterium]|nr:hypothetical protein [Planctomycetota bacterium]